MPKTNAISILVAAPTGDEKRVAMTPDAVAGYRKRGYEIAVESGAGTGAHYPDTEYERAGAAVVELGDWSGFDLILTVTPWGHRGLESVSEGAVVVGFLDPHRRQDELRELTARGASAVAVELVPRITRAQSMDALSSQASIAGYKAVILAAHHLQQYFPLLMTAAGTVPPATVVVMGGGVAGLQALATAKRLGAVVEVSDIREAVREQVESLGGRFIDLPELGDAGEGSGGYAREMTPEFLAEQRRIVAERVAEADVVITTAQVPGKRAPLLVTEEMVESMRPGGVIVDIAAAQGGNCALTAADQEIVHSGVTILGPTNLAADAAHDASRLYSRNLLELVQHIVGDEATKPLKLDLDDEITGQVVVTDKRPVERDDVPPPAENEES